MEPMQAKKIKTRQFFNLATILLATYVILLFISSTPFAQVSKLNKTEFVFGNGSGWESVGTNATPSMRAKLPVMLRSGRTIESILNDSSASFYQQFTTPTLMINAIKDRMLGMIASFAYVPNANTGWLVCDGSEYSTAQYQQLANLLRATYSTAGTGHLNSDGDWAGRFKVPDLRGLFIMGSTSTTNVTTINIVSTIPLHTHFFTAAGSKQINTPAASSAAHTHTIKSLLESSMNTDFATDSGSGLRRGSSSDAIPDTVFSTVNNHSHTFPALTMRYGVSTQSLTPARLITENRPPNAAVIFCIYSGVP